MPGMISKLEVSVRVGVGVVRLRRCCYLWERASSCRIPQVSAGVTKEDGVQNHVLSVFVITLVGVPLLRT
jgi:hypothetical protein